MAGRAVAAATNPQQTLSGSVSVVEFTSQNSGGGPFEGFGIPEAFVDIDGDGDFDVFRGDRTRDGSVDFFENEGTAAEPAFAERTGSANPLDAVNVTIPEPPLQSGRAVPSFVDVDDDGDFDAFIGSRAGVVSFFENTGTATDPAFVERTVSDNPLGGVDVGYDARPLFADIDDDGDYDAVVGGYYYSVYSRINFFENTGSAASPTFVARTDGENPFHDFRAYGGNVALTLVDIDADGDIDAFTGFGFHENRGTASSPDFVSNVAGPLSHFGHGDLHALGSVPSFVDIDADDDYDAFVGGHFFVNEGTATDPAFPESSSPNPFGAVNVGYDPRPTFVDIDDDGDLDAFIGFDSYYQNVPSSAFFENVGTSNHAVFSNAMRPSPLPIGRGDAPAFVDIDNDGDFDAFVGRPAGDITYFENTGNAADPVFVVGTSTLSGVDVGLQAAPALVDIDNDGDFDAFIASGEYYNSSIHFFENTGTPNTANFVARTSSDNPLSFVEVRYEDRTFGGFTPAFADVDLDGDFDVVVGSIGGGVLFFENTGSSGNAVFVERTGSENPLSVHGYRTAPAFADIDDDGDPDLLIGLGSPLGFYARHGEILFFRNETAAPSDSTPPECEIVSIDKGPPTRLNIRVQDDASGLASITVLNDVNSTISWPTFPSGSTDAIVVVAEKIMQAKRSVVALRVMDVAGNATECDPVLTTLTADVPEAFMLEQNYPNPFNPQTTIRLRVADAAHVRLAVYDVTGREVMRLLDAPTSAGIYEVKWNGRDAAGQIVPSGLYFYRMWAGAFEQARTMMIVR